jgi:hypothetical protein
MALIAIPVSREILEDTCNVDQQRLFGTTDISKCQVPTLARLDRVAFLAHLASGRYKSCTPRAVKRCERHGSVMVQYDPENLSRESEKF